MIDTIRIWKTLLMVILFSGCIIIAGAIYFISKIITDPAFAGIAGVVLGMIFGVWYTNLFIRKTRPRV